MADDNIVPFKPDNDNKVISLRAHTTVAKRAPTLEEQNAAWVAYAEARTKADRTLRFEDGKAAALAYGHFIDLFVRQELGVNP